MEVNERALEQPEGEDAVCAASEAALDGRDHGAILDDACLVHKVDIALYCS